MKTLFALTFATALTFGMVSCGPSDAEKKADSAQLDSTAKGMHSEADHTIDSMNAANAAAAKADSIKNANAAQHMMDSVVQAKNKKK
ncbi:MAG TPA: hypothetical protein VFJ43_17555 [Bacteroidia bacterium]|nr:hypothetical protein [Bacteroidia bacterium]